MVVLLLAARLALTVVFWVSGIGKVVDPAGTRRAIEGFGLSSGLARIGARALPVAEIGVGALLLGSSTAWWGSLGALALLAAFCVAIGVNLRRGRAPDCHCFGQLHSEPVSAKTLVRNTALAVPAILVVVAGWTDPGPSAVAWLADLRPSEAILAGVCAVLTACLVAMAGVMRRLVAGQRELAESVAAMERLVDARDDGRTSLRAAAAQTPKGLPFGAVAPDGRLTSRRGDEVTLGDLAKDHRVMALVFVSQSCSPCRELLPKLDRWQREWSGRLPLIVVAPGSRDANATLLADYPHLGLYVAGDAPVGMSYRAPWTPAAVVVSNGRIASETMFGLADIESLLTTAAAGAQLAPSDSKIGSPAPVFAGVDDGGQPITSHTFAAGPTALLYWSSTCGFCSAMAGELGAWADQQPSRVPRLLLISQKTDPIPHRFGAEAVIVDVAGDIVRAFGFTGTPSALLVAADGTIASSMCVGREDVKSLLGVPHVSTSMTRL